MFSRYQRMAGNKVLMVSGTDEHGTPIQVQADAEGVTARELADRYNRVIAEDLAGLGMSYDLFTRTTTAQPLRGGPGDLHRPVRQRLHLPAQDAIGAISPSTGRTLPDRYIEGTCPICGYDSARGDQCDNCGNQLDPADLINPRSKINGETPEFVETEHFFLDLPAFADVLGTWLQGKSGQWRPNVLKFSLNLLADLQPRAITRDLDWGVPIPLDGWRDRPGQADLRLVRRGHRLPVGVDRVGAPGPATRTPGARGGRARTPSPTTSWARTTSSSTPRSGRRCCSATAARAPGAASRARSAR